MGPNGPYGTKWAHGLGGDLKNTARYLQGRRGRRPRGLLIFAACLWLMAGALAHGQQQQVPAVRVDQLLNRLYPGNTGEIERRLATSATLAATPLPTIKPAATPAPLVIRLRRAQSGDRATTASRAKSVGDHRSTRATPALIIPLRPDSVEPKTTPTVARMPAPRPTESGDVSSYLSSLEPAAQDQATSSTAAAGKKAPAAVPLDLVGHAVNVNRATAAELVQTLGVDVRRARLIIEFRTQQGRIRGPDDLAQVNGLTEDMIMEWEQKGLLRFE
ncbi:MAG: helix-hairpin-helix domain-containing protein [Candidatus Sumerlaeia bacterium]